MVGNYLCQGSKTKKTLSYSLLGSTSTAGFVVLVSQVFACQVWSPHIRHTDWKSIQRHEYMGEGVVLLIKILLTHHKKFLL